MTYQFLIYNRADENFVFLYDPELYEDVLRQIAKFAADPTINLSWYEAAMLSQSVRAVANSGSQSDPVPSFIRRKA